MARRVPTNPFSGLPTQFAAPMPPNTGYRVQAANREKHQANPNYHAVALPVIDSRNTNRDRRTDWLPQQQQGIAIDLATGQPALGAQFDGDRAPNPLPVAAMKITK